MINLDSLKVLFYKSQLIVYFYLFIEVCVSTPW